MKDIEAIGENLEEEKKQELTEKYLLASFRNLKWQKFDGMKRTIYKSFFDKKSVVLTFNKASKRSDRVRIFSLTYDGKPFKGEEKDIASLYNSIRDEKKTPRKKITVEHVNNEKRKRRNKKKKNLKEGLNEEKKQELEVFQELQRIGIKDFVVRRSLFKCIHNEHEVIDVAATVHVVGNDGKIRLVRINAGYCKQCHVYFIMESTFTSLKNMGVVLCRISDEKTYLKTGFANGMKLASESILMQFGYNVSQQEGLSETGRQKILAVMIDNHVLSKNEIISYLDFFINQRRSQNKFEVAVCKWEADREFVQGYRIGEYTQFGVNAIYRY